MELITLCGAVILVFGLWLELETVIRRIGSAVLKSKIATSLISPSTEQSPVYTRYITDH